MTIRLNVLGTQLSPCCAAPPTGFYRDGFCRTDASDHGRHVVCAVMTDAFLNYTKQKGNDLTTPMPHALFPGLKAGDKWCLCAARWQEAYAAGVAPPVILEACDERALDTVSLSALKAHAYAL